MTGPLSPSRTERPIFVRGGILMFGLIIVSSTYQRWATVPPEGAPPTPIWLYVIPLVLASSMILQFFAKERGSRWLLVSLGVILLSLLLLFGFWQGWLR